MCISWTIKGLISLMHGITMKMTLVCLTVTFQLMMMRKNLTSCRRLVVDNFRQDAPFLWKYVEILSSVIQKEPGTIFRNSYFLRRFSIFGVSKKTHFFLLN